MSENPYEAPKTMTAVVPEAGRRVARLWRIGLAGCAILSGFGALVPSSLDIIESVASQGGGLSVEPFAYLLCALLLFPLAIVLLRGVPATH